MQTPMCRQYCYLSRESRVETGVDGDDVDSFMMVHPKSDACKGQFGMQVSRSFQLFCAL